MKNKSKPLSLRWWVVAGIIAAIILVFLLAYLSQGTSPTKNPTYAQALNNYIIQLQKDGLAEAGEVKPKGGGDPFIQILVPTSGEVPAAQVQDLINLIIFTSSVFEERQGLRSDDIVITFQRPTAQRIIYISRPQGLLDPLGLNAEFSISSSQGHDIVSVVNLSGMMKTLGRPYTTDWATVQAVCLGYSIQGNPDADAACNVISVNAAAGWAGIDRSSAMSFLSDGGSTGLSYLGAKDYKFRFIDFVYNSFVQK